MSLCVESFPPTRGDTTVSYDFLVFGGISKRQNTQMFSLRPCARKLVSCPASAHGKRGSCVCLSVCGCVCVRACSVLLKTNVHLKSEKKSSFR